MYFKAHMTHILSESHILSPTVTHAPTRTLTLTEHFELHRINFHCHFIRTPSLTVPIPTLHFLPLPSPLSHLFDSYTIVTLEILNLIYLRCILSSSLLNDAKKNSSSVITALMNGGWRYT